MAKKRKKENEVFPYGMTSREFNFCLRYLESGFNFSAAIDYAYNYSELTKNQVGYHLFSRPAINRYLREQIEIIMEKVRLDSAQVVKEVSDILQDQKQAAKDRLKAAEILLKFYDGEDEREARRARKYSGTLEIPTDNKDEHKKLSTVPLPELPNKENIQELYGEISQEITDVEPVDGETGEGVHKGGGNFLDLDD